MQPHNPYTPPQSVIAETPANPTTAAIDALDVSEKWKLRFKALALAGGPKMPHIKSLSKADRRHVVGFNILAFLFGPFYYAAKGMWRKAISLFALMAAIVIALGLVLDAFGLERVANALGYGVGAVFAVRANIDYYKKMVLGDNGWW